MSKFVYFFGGGKGEGSKEMKALLGGKGANLAEMTSIGLPVPPGFTISTEVCDYYYKHDNTYPPELDTQIDEAIARVEKVMGRKFGDPENPLFFSVRSGAAQSMPGMMDTVLNLGMNEETLPGFIRLTGNERLAWDSYRRFINMFGSVVMGLEHHHFEEVFDGLKKEVGAEVDTDLTAEQLKELCSRYSALYEKHVGKPFPREPRMQLLHSVDAVFGSWMKPSAVTYRRINRITGLLGTAVNVQTMGFGNMGETSGTGVAFTRDPATGENVFYGEFLMNAQGEDVVSGIRTPREISELGSEMPDNYKQLLDVRQTLEKHYKDIQDLEFTIENGTLFILQTRNGKRTGFAAFRIAVEMVEEGLTTPQEALKQIEPDGVTHLLVRLFEPKALAEARKEGRRLAKALNAGPGAASGEVVFSADRAEEMVNSGKKVVLCRTETSPDDIHGMHVSEGILTQRGGMTSHAAVVARQIGTPCVAGCSELDIDYGNLSMKVKKDDGRTVTLKEGDVISLDGITGEVFEGPIATMPSEVIQVLIDGTMKAEESKTYQNYVKIMEWANEFKKIGVRTNADTPRDSDYAVRFGAEGIGLTRTEHMFFGEDRIAFMQEMILAENEETRRAALEKLLPFQREDFIGIFRAMDGYPVTIRTLDPPLHEFVPHEEKAIARVVEKTGIPKEKILAAAERLHELNPMLGHRGVRLSVTYPEIAEMQVRAIMEAACIVKKEGIDVKPEIMIPLVGHRGELRFIEKIARPLIEKIFEEQEIKVDYLFGTMIEVPRGAITADKVAEVAEFFSYGTNDLTQMTYGFSRDDAGPFIQHYQKKEVGIFDTDPFAVIDEEGVGFLVKLGIERGRKTRPDLKIGICGEHGGEPNSVKFCARVGMNYVSCSPRRVPVAIIAAAHAALEE